MMKTRGDNQHVAKVPLQKMETLKKTSSFLQEIKSDTKQLLQKPKHIVLEKTKSHRVQYEQSVYGMLLLVMNSMVSGAV